MTWELRDTPETSSPRKTTGLPASLGRVRGGGQHDPQLGPRNVLGATGLARRCPWGYVSVAAASGLCETPEKPLEKPPPASPYSEPRPGPISLSPPNTGKACPGGGKRGRLLGVGPAPPPPAGGGWRRWGNRNDCLEAPLSTVWEKRSRLRHKRPPPRITSCTLTHALGTSNVTTIVQQP